MSDDLEVRAALRRIEEKLESQQRRLRELENKVTVLMETAQRSAEMTTRLKLMADMAKEAGAAQSESIERIARIVSGGKAK